MTCADCGSLIKGNQFYYRRTGSLKEYLCRACKTKVDPDQMITNRIIEKADQITQEQQSTQETVSCYKCGATIPPNGPNRCVTCSITLDFCIWVQASFDELVEEINKGMGVFKASSGK